MCVSPGGITCSCVSSKYRFTETDDVDDVYTEKGRLLIQKVGGARPGPTLGSRTAVWWVRRCDVGAPVVQGARALCGWQGVVAA